MQVRATADGRYKDDLLQLNLQPNCDGVQECWGRVQGHYPIYLPDGQRYMEKLVAQAHLATLHWGSWEYNGESGRVLLGATAEEINQKDCEVLPWMSAVQGAGLYLSTTRESSKGSHRGPNTLPSDWSGLCRTFEVPEKPKTEGKAYILLYACSLTRAVYVDLVPNLETTEIIRSLKCFITQRGRPQRVYSDNAKTFVRGSKLIKHPHPAED